MRSGNFVEWNEAWDGDSESHDGAHMFLQFVEVHAKKSQKFFGDFHFEILFSEYSHLKIIVFLAAGMHIAGAAEASDIAIEFGADVVEFVEDGDEFFVERQIQKPRQQKGEDVQCFLSSVVHLLNGPESPFTTFYSGTALETQGSQSSLNAPFDW